MKRIALPLLLTTLFNWMLTLLGTAPVAAREGGAGSDAVTVARCQDFKVTGDGSSAEWDKTRWIDIPQRAEKPVTYRTRAKVLYSETGIYFLFDCQDGILNATMNEDFMNLWEEDVVEVFLWTEEDFPVYFEYEISPLNYELPIMVPNYHGHFYGWLPWHYEGDRRIQHETSVQGGPKKPKAEIESWMAEFFIPYELLTPLQHIPPESGTRWRVNLYRIDYDQGPTQFTWQKVSKTFHDYNSFGTFLFQ